MAYNQGWYKDGQNTTSDYTIYRSSDVTVYDKSARTNAGTVINSGTVTHSGANTFTGSITASSEATFSADVNLGAAGIIKHAAAAYTTASTGTAITPGSFITVSSTKTVKNLTLYGSTVGTELLIHCLSASATGWIQVNVDSSAGAASRSFDTGGNYLYRFKKAGHGVKIMLVSTGRWVEIMRTVADGTAITSTAT